MRRFSLLNSASLAFGFAFLYVPIALLVIYSFNASRLVTVWGGFSTRWYASLLSNQQMLDSVKASLTIALLSAGIATVLGSLAAYALARRGRFRTRPLFAAMIYAPLVMPEVITGLSLLLLFVALGIERGVATIVVAHATVSLCFVAVVVYPRFAGMDRSLEEAAMDLGASPARTFAVITLPLAAPAILSGFLLATTLSLDDLVIATFTSGPGSTTLPMRIYSQVRLGVTPEVNAISTLMIGFVALCLLASLALRRRGRAETQGLTG
jgi:putrescine transport system permease protein